MFGLYFLFLVSVFKLGYNGGGYIRVSDLDS